jgi:hypothetical protein
VISHGICIKTLFLIYIYVSFQIREEPPSYSTSVLQKRESFDNLHAGVGVEVLDHTRILIRVPVPGILNPGKHCMTSQQAAMIRYIGCNSWLNLISLKSNASSLMGHQLSGKQSSLIVG